jgi:hypothetical protein
MTQNWEGSPEESACKTTHGLVHMLPTNVPSGRQDPGAAGRVETGLEMNGSI